MINRLRDISKAEQCNFEDGADEPVLDEILNLSEGDMRRAVTMLQSAQALSMGGAIKKESIAEMVRNILFMDSIQFYNKKFTVRISFNIRPDCHQMM